MSYRSQVEQLVNDAFDDLEAINRSTAAGSHGFGQPGRGGMASTRRASVKAKLIDELETITENALAENAVDA